MTLLQNELNNNTARFTTHNQTCLATNQTVAGCKKVLQGVDLLYETKSVHVKRFNSPRQTCFAASDINLVCAKQLAHFYRVVKSSQLLAKIATYLVSISLILCLEFLYGWHFLNKIQCIPGLAAYFDNSSHLLQNFLTTLFLLPVLL